MIVSRILLDSRTLSFRASIEWSVVCARCGVGERLDTFQVPFGGEIPRPTLLAGWRMLDGFLLCPRHAITISDEDGGKP